MSPRIEFRFEFHAIPINLFMERLGRLRFGGSLPKFARESANYRAKCSRHFARTVGGSTPSFDVPR